MFWKCADFLSLLHEFACYMWIYVFVFRHWKKCYMLTSMCPLKLHAVMRWLDHKCRIKQALWLTILIWSVLAPVQWPRIRCPVAYRFSHAEWIKKCRQHPRKKIEVWHMYCTIFLCNCITLKCAQCIHIYINMINECCTTVKKSTL